MKELIKNAANSYNGQLKEYRRFLHSHPELSFQEVETSIWIKKKLNELEIPVMKQISKNSVVGYLEGYLDGPVIAFRADMDALPIQEENDIPYKSEVPNVMHACGHDAHTATLLCFAEYIKKHLELLKGKVLFIFQQGEELIPGGSKQLIEDGVLEGVDAIFAWHIDPDNQLGQINLAAGPRTAAADTFKISIHGKEGHGGFPHKAINPIVSGSLIASAIFGIPALNIAPGEAGIITISHFHSGQTGVHNIIPKTAVIEGGIRTLNNELIEVLEERVKKISEGICKAQNCTCEVEIMKGYPAVINDKAVVDKITSAIGILGYEIVATAPIMGSEDFARYLLKIPGAFISIGCSNPEKPETISFPHNARLMIDENVMKIAFETLLAIYIKITN